MRQASRQYVVHGIDTLALPESSEVVNIHSRFAGGPDQLQSSCSDQVLTAEQPLQPSPKAEQPGRDRRTLSCEQDLEGSSSVCAPNACGMPSSLNHAVSADESIEHRTSKEIAEAAACGGAEPIKKRRKSRRSKAATSAAAARHLEAAATEMAAAAADLSWQGISVPEGGTLGRMAGLGEVPSSSLESK